MTSWIPGYTTPKKDAQATDHKEWVPASNVTRLCRIVADVHYTKDGKEIEQMSFYQNGVATGALTALGEAWTGAFGVGLNENVCEAYVWLCLNWIPGDEIFIFGFSRGAFTARALSGLVFHLGIINRSNLGDFHSIYDAFTKREQTGHEQTWVDKKNELQDGRTGSDVMIKVVGVWDTVKSLGFPENERVRRYTAALGWDRKHAFHDATTCDNVENAFHALALDEKRAAFSPTLWYLPSSATAGTAKTNLQQCWFPGSHSDVGGSYEDAQPFDSSYLSLMWMIRQCRPFLAFNNGRLRKELEPYDKLSWWGAQPLHDSYTPQFYLNGKEIRRPGQYFKMEDVAVAPKAVGPRNEFVHASVRLRLLRAQMTAQHKEGSAGAVEPKVKLDKYDCTAMAGFRLERVKNPAEPNHRYKWVKEVVHNGKPKPVELVEDPLGEDEHSMLTDDVRELLDDPAKSDKLIGIPLGVEEKSAPKPVGMFKKACGYIGFA